MRTYAIAYVSTAVVFLLLDGTWLSLTAGILYRPAIGHIMLDKPDLWAAVAFYVLYLLGVVILVIQPALSSGDGWRAALRLGAVLGLVAYATYDLTNQAVLRDWPLRLTIVDLIWGTIVTAVSAAVGTAITGWVVTKWAMAV